MQVNPDPVPRILAVRNPAPAHRLDSRNGA
jgi:hypothetical protein